MTIRELEAELRKALGDGHEVRVPYWSREACPIELKSLTRASVADAVKRVVAKCKELGHDIAYDKQHGNKPKAGLVWVRSKNLHG